MSFVVNGAEWCFDGMDPADVGRAFEKVLQFVGTSVERSEAVQIGDDFQSRHMLGTLSLWELCSAETGLGLSGDLQQELAAWLGRAEYYADSDEWPEGAEDSQISIGTDAPFENADVAWVHHSIRAGIPAACLTLGEAFIGNVSSSEGTLDVHFVCDDSSRKNFWRDAIVLKGDSHLSLTEFAARAYPNLYFAGGTLQDVTNLSGGYNAARERVQNTFQILDDFGHWIFTFPPPAVTPDESGTVSVGENPTNQLIESRFGGFGLSAAPEKPNVYAVRACREARETILNGRRIYCEWHIKLEAHRNRIHLHPPIHESGDKVVVGMIHEHLPLP
ncbi:hypothetical protein [Yoonia sp. BS5-3]|uniref:Uncharacterized protein n=1 Tax=Yoonia phaeophyticola TaxID=3137369 RepID=A0ABZ2UYS6_9RHOB